MNCGKKKKKLLAICRAAHTLHCKNSAGIVGSILGKSNSILKKHMPKYSRKMEFEESVVAETKYMKNYYFKKKRFGFYLYNHQSKM